MIYLDNSATTKPCDAAVAAMEAMLRDGWYNPSAAYGPAMRVEKQIGAARAQVAGALGIEPGRIVFTAGGTEADSLAILGTAARFRGPRRVLLFAGEHSAVRLCAGQLEAMGHTAEWIAADGCGVLDLDRFAGQLGEDVGLVSVMHVGNETGAVQPLAEVRRLMRAACPGALLHSDGVQAFLRLPQAFAQTGVDLYSVSAHKVHGPKGVGALAVADGVRLLPRVVGGGQEGGVRSGTENTAGIAGMGAAVEWARGQADAAERLRTMKLRLFALLSEAVDGLRVNGPAPNSQRAAPHILNVSFPGVPGEALLHALEAEGVLVGTGAACSTKKRAMSAAFAAMDAPRWAAESAIRFSLGLMNTPWEVERAAEVVGVCYRRYAVR